MYNVIVYISGGLHRQKNNNNQTKQNETWNKKMTVRRNNKKNINPTAHLPYTPDPFRDPDGIIKNIILILFADLRSISRYIGLML